MSETNLGKSARTRLRLVQAVRRELESEGAISATAVARRADSSPATFYNHFASQDDAVLAAFEAAMTDLVSVLRTGLNVEMALEFGIDAFARRWTWTCIEFFRANSLIFGKARSLMQSAPAIRRVFLTHEAEALAVTTRFIRLGQRAGVIRPGDTEALAEVLMLTSEGWNHPRILKCGEGSPLHLALAQSVVATLSPGAAPALDPSTDTGGLP